MKHTVSEISLANGVKGLLVHVPGASVMTFDINFRAGEYLVEREKWETPHLMEHLLLGANELTPRAHAFHAEFEMNGAYSNASTGTYDITYEAECADFEWDRILGLLTVAITRPLFLPEEYEAEFGNVREELNARSNNHFRHLSLALRQKYGFCVLTDQVRLPLMENVTIQDIREHYEKTHTSSNLRFVIAGNLPAKRRKVIETLFSTIELPLGNGLTPLPTELPKALQRPLYIPNETVDNVYFYIDTFMGRQMSDPESDALSLLNTMLTETMYSRILGAAREKGLVYHMSSGFGQAWDSTNWWFVAQVMPRNARPLFDIMVKELLTMFGGKLADTDITMAQQYLLGRYQRSAQTVGGTANGYSSRYFFDGKIDDYYQLPERINAITKDGVIDIARNMFKESIWGFGALSNCGDEFVEELHHALSPLWDNK